MIETLSDGLFSPPALALPPVNHSKMQLSPIEQGGFVERLWNYLPLHRTVKLLERKSPLERRNLSTGLADQKKMRPASAGRRMRLAGSYRAGLKIAPTAPLLVTRVAQVQDFTSDPLRLAGQPLGSGMTGVQLAENPPNIDPGFGDAVRVTGSFNEKFAVQPS